MSRLTNLSRVQIILLHSLLWICFLFFPLLIYRIDFFTKQFFTRDLINNAFLIGLFYLHFYYLIPRYFNGQKITAYFIMVLLFVLVFMLQQIYVEYLFMQYFENGKPYFKPGFKMHDMIDDTARMAKLGKEQVFQRHDHTPFGGKRRFFSMPPPFWIGGVRHSLSGIFSVLLAGGFSRMALQWFKTEKQKEELEIQKLNDELGLLKAQINPHFLFNSLNTVYSLARKQSHLTEEVILKLSDILRYVIYEASAHKVPLAKELAYIENYIELQKYRTGKQMSIRLAQAGDPGVLMIEPMLLIIFVENAFKHGISYREGAFIDISISTEDTLLSMQVSNTFTRQTNGELAGGIGLQNVRKRLQLSYPSRYELHISDNENIFTVSLTIDLQHD